MDAESGKTLYNVLTDQALSWKAPFVVNKPIGITLLLKNP